MPLRNVFGDEPNTNITPVSLGLPGVLPVVNKVAVESAIKPGSRLDAISHLSRILRVKLLLPGLPEELPDLAASRSYR